MQIVELEEKKQLINEITEQIIRRLYETTALSLKSDLEGPDTVSSFAKEMPRRYVLVSKKNVEPRKGPPYHSPKHYTLQNIYVWYKHCSVYAGDFCFSLGSYSNTLIMCLFLNITLYIT